MPRCSTSGWRKAGHAGDAASQTATVLTEAGVVSGTLLYMSPEQARGEAVDERSDVFSFGIVLYQLVRRVHPFGQDSWAETLAAILTRDPRPIAIALPSELRRILRKCLEKDRARRYQTMRDAAIDLENLAQETKSASTEALTPAALSPGSEDEHAGLRGCRCGHCCSGRCRRGASPGGTATRTLSGLPLTRRSPTSPILRRLPRLSADGRMVTFIRGGSWFLTTTGQIYVKMLPNGEAVKVDG